MRGVAEHVERVDEAVCRASARPGAKAGRRRGVRGVAGVLVVGGEAHVVEEGRVQGVCTVWESAP